MKGGYDLTGNEMQYGPSPNTQAVNYTNLLVVQPATLGEGARVASSTPARIVAMPAA